MTGYQWLGATILAVPFLALVALTFLEEGMYALWFWFGLALTVTVIFVGISLVTGELP